MVPSPIKNIPNSSLLKECKIIKRKTKIEKNLMKDNLKLNLKNFL